MNINDAFIIMLSERGIHKKLEIDKRRSSYLKKRAERKQPIFYETMSTLLIKAGWIDKGWENTNLQAQSINKKIKCDCYSYAHKIELGKTYCSNCNKLLI